jgi:hypothetical protein
MLPRQILYHLSHTPLQDFDVKSSFRFVSKLIGTDSFHIFPSLALV